MGGLHHSGQFERVSLAANSVVPDLVSDAGGSEAQKFVLVRPAQGQFCVSQLLRSEMSGLGSGQYRFNDPGGQEGEANCSRDEGTVDVLAPCELGDRHVARGNLFPPG